MSFTIAVSLEPGGPLGAAFLFPKLKVGAFYAPETKLQPNGGTGFLPVQFPQGASYAPFDLSAGHAPDITARGL